MKYLHLEEELQCPISDTQQCIAEFYPDYYLRLKARRKNIQRIMSFKKSCLICKQCVCCRVRSIKAISRKFCHSIEQFFQQLPVYLHFFEPLRKIPFVYPFPRIFSYPLLFLKYRPVQAYILPKLVQSALFVPDKQ